MGGEYGDFNDWQGVGAGKEEPFEDGDIKVTGFVTSMKVVVGFDVADVKDPGIEVTSGGWLLRPMALNEDREIGVVADADRVKLNPLDGGTPAWRVNLRCEVVNDTQTVSQWTSRFVLSVGVRLPPRRDVARNADTYYAHRQNCY